MHTYHHSEAPAEAASVNVDNILNELSEEWWEESDAQGCAYVSSYAGVLKM